MTDPASPSPPTAATSPEEAIKQYVAASHLHSQPTFDLLVLLTNEGTVSYISPSVTPLLGYAPAELIGRPATLFVHADDLETMQQVSPTRGQRAGRSLKANYRLRAKSGAQHMFEGSGLNLLHLPGIGAIAALFRRATQHELAPPVRWSDFSGRNTSCNFMKRMPF
jgi:PAS domain S-box-containing protein